MVKRGLKMYHITRNEILLFIAGVAAVYIAGSLSQAVVERAAAGLDRGARERVWQREARLRLWWLGPDIAAVALMFMGVLQCANFIRILPRGWGVPVLAAGLAALSLSSSLRAWLSSRAYQAEAPGSNAARSAFRACVVVAAAELALAGAVCWYVLARAPAAASTGAAPPASGSGPATTIAVPEKTGEKRDLFWVDEAEALRLLKGKDAAYLNALVRRQDIRAKVEDGRKLYRRDDISALKTAGLPSLEELREDLKDR